MSFAFTVFLLVLAATVAYALLKSQSAAGSDIVIPPPATLRTDLKFGFYGTFGNQVAETKAFVNMLWECFWNGEDQAIENILAANCLTVLDVTGYVFARDAANAAFGLRPDGDAALRALFDKLKAAGALGKVKVIVPIDEPNLPATNACDALPGAVALIRAVAAGYPELAGLKVGCTYYSGSPKQHIELFDVVGYDDYPAKSGLLAPGGEYEAFRATLKPGQMTMLYPGGENGQDPTPFVNYAQANPEVAMLVCFIWRSPNDPNAAKYEIVGSPLEAAYEVAGASICGGQE